MNTRYIVALIVTLVVGCRQAPRTDAKQVVEIMVDGKEVSLNAGRGYFWADPVYNDSRTVAYLLKNHGNPSRGYSPHSIVKVTKDLVVDPVVANSEILEGDILQIYKVSMDGLRLLVNLHYVTKKEGQSTHYDTRPVIYNVGKSEIGEVEF
ncbi:MAG: hypothetical protein ACYSUY_10850 [Planctomycetota bacterium]|jgi:hypothetical protein